MCCVCGAHPSEMAYICCDACVPPKWQAMDTAPKNGTSVLLFCPAGSQFSIDQQAIAYWCTDAEVWYSLPAEIELDEPSAWMKLPSPPNVD